MPDRICLDSGEVSTSTGPALRDPPKVSSWRRYLTAFFAFLLAALAGGLLTTPAFCDVRVALVVGNSHYAGAAALDNPAHDASDLSDALTGLGFKTTLLVDASKRAMDRAVEQFARDSRTADVALFFFAGHGMQFQGRNYVVPVDAELKDEISVAYELTALDDLKSALQNSNGVKVLVLDSCRDNPLAEKLSRSMRVSSRDLRPTQGFAPFERTSGMIVAYSTQSGQIAHDGSGRNSPFSAALLKELQTPRLELGTLFRRVQSDVFEATNGAQEPELSISLVPETYLNMGDTDQTIWARIREKPDVDALRDFLAKYPHSFFAPDAAVRLKILTGSATPADETPKPPPTREAKLDADKPARALEAPSGPSEIDMAREARERLYALNFDPGPAEGPFGEAAREAVRQFERKTKLPVDGAVSQELLNRLRDAPALKPWGAIVFDKDRAKWGMAWGHDTRKAAVAQAQTACGASSCPVEVSFFGASCAAFAHSALSWSIDARADIAKATDAALTTCRKQGGECRIVASVCADGSQRSTASR